MEGFGVSANPDPPSEGGVLGSVFDKIKETVPQFKAASDYMFPPTNQTANNTTTTTSMGNQDYQRFDPAGIATTRFVYIGDPF